MKLQPFQIVIADDQPHSRSLIKDVLELDPIFKVTGEADTVQAAIDMLNLLKPDILLIDILMDKMKALEAMKRMKEQVPELKMVVFTSSEDIAHLFESLKRGAQGYMQKSLHPSFCHEYLRSVALDDVSLSREAAYQILNEMSRIRSQLDKPALLNAGEREVLSYLCKLKRSFNKR